MDSVSISAHEVEQAAASLSRMNQQLRAHLDAVTQKMRQLSSCWDSPAGAALQERFDQLLPVFDRYEQVMEQYVACLRETARSYQDAEHMLKQQASSVGILIQAISCVCRRWSACCRIAVSTACVFRMARSAGRCWT